MADLKTAASAVPSVLVAQYVPVTGDAQYPAPAGTTTQLSVRVVNADPSVARTVRVIVVKSGGSAGTTPPFLPLITLAAGGVLDLGEMFLNEGDSIWAEAGTASTIGIIITGIVFSNSTGAVLSGIQDDAIGTGGRTSGTGTVAGSIPVSTASNRCVLVPLACTMTTTGPSYTGYDTLQVLCGATPMTRLVSADFNDGGNLGGSVHWFGILNPPSGTISTLTANVAEAGKSFNLTMLPPIAKSGVASFGATASTGPSSAAAMSLAIASAIGRRVFFVGGFDTPPVDFVPQAVRGFNGNPAVAFTRPHWSVSSEAPGAASVTATAASQPHCGAAVELIPA